MGSRIQVFAADDRTGDGVIPSLALLDELHRHPDLRLYRTWRGKLTKRNGQLATISTAGEPGSEFEETRERIRQGATTVTRKGGFTRYATDKLVLHEYAVPEDGDVTDMRVVKSANPLKQITIATLRAKWASPTMTLGHWKRFVCDQATRSELAAITEAEWARAATNEQIPEGAPIDVGLDVAWKLDTTAAVPLWCRDNEFRLFGPARVLVPPRDGNSLDAAEVENALTEINARNPIRTLVMDMSRAEQLAQWAEAEFSCVVVDWPQTNPEAVREYDLFMEALRNGWLHHSGDAGLTSHALNAIAKDLPFGDARFDRPTQSRKGPEQNRRVIDALKAAAMVHDYALTRVETPVHRSYYEDHDLEVA